MHLKPIQPHPVQLRELLPTQGPAAQSPLKALPKALPKAQRAVLARIEQTAAYSVVPKQEKEEKEGVKENRSFFLPSAQRSV